MRKLSIILGLIFFLVACSNENSTKVNKDVNSDSEPMNQSKELRITKEFVEKNSIIGLSYDEVREVFGTEQYSGIMDNTMNFLYDSTNYKPLTYNQGGDSVAHNEIKSGKLDYQLYISFMDEKAIVYSYFYKGKNGKVWQYQASTNSGKLVEIPVSD